MRDRLTNEVKAGDLLYWTQTGLVVEVVEALDDDTPKVELPGVARGQQAHGKITVKIAMPVPRQGIAAGEEILLTDFIRVMNPKSEKVLDGLMRGGPALLPPRGGKPS